MIRLPSPKMQGLYKFEAIKYGPDGVETSRRTLTEWCENIVTDFGLNQKCGGPAGNAGFSQISVAVGTGNTAPLPTDTRLESFLVSAFSSSSSQGGVVGPPSYGWWRNVTTFGVGAAAGNLAEVGAAISGIPISSTTDLISRSLIKDAEGDPTSITVLPDEALQVTTEFRLYSPPWASADDDYVTTDTIDGILRTITIRPMNAGSANWHPMQGANGIGSGSQVLFDSCTLGAATTGPSWGGKQSVSQGQQGGSRTYVNNSHQRRYFLRTPTGTLRNVAGYTFQTGMGFWQVKVHPPVVKELTEVFTFDIMIAIGRP